MQNIVKSTTLLLILCTTVFSSDGGLLGISSGVLVDEYRIDSKYILSPTIGMDVSIPFKCDFFKVSVGGEYCFKNNLIKEHSTSWDLSILNKDGLLQKVTNNKKYLSLGGSFIRVSISSFVYLNKFYVGSSINFEREILDGFEFNEQVDIITKDVVFVEEVSSYYYRDIRFLPSFVVGYEWGKLAVEGVWLGMHKTQINLKWKLLRINFNNSKLKKNKGDI